MISAGGIMRSGTAMDIRMEMCIRDSINPFDLAVDTAVKAGVTSACVCPGSDSVVGGICSVVKLKGKVAEEMVPIPSSLIQIWLWASISPGVINFPFASTISSPASSGEIPSATLIIFQMCIRDSGKRIQLFPKKHRFFRMGLYPSRIPHNIEDGHRLKNCKNNDAVAKA